MLAGWAWVADACSGTSDEPATRGERSTRAEVPREREVPPRARPTSDVPPQPPSVYPAPARLVAIGDVHGDLDAYRAALRLAGAIGRDDHWTGGALFVVQVGDLLDRGDDEPEILALTAQLEREASAAGGHFVALNGNHEFMNSQLDFRYVTPEGFTDFDRYREQASREARRELPRAMHGRAGAFEPGSEHARAFAARNVAVVVGDTVFVHGGLVPEVAAQGLDAINQAARAFFLGQRPLARMLQSEDSPVWHRGYAVEDGPETCAQLEDALGRVHAARMVVGHTVQQGGITSACDERVFRIDVGLSRHYGGPVQVLEIEGGAVRVLRGER
ncbi:MAG: hypothetical protein OHK0013_30510 [Sandaracinaceae bacterium]